MGALLPNPLFDLSEADYQEYHDFMNQGEANYTEMTILTNKLHQANEKLQALLNEMDTSKQADLMTKGKALSQELKQWDELMVQRLSKAYDDVENFENGFTAHYLTVINSVDSHIPRITAGAKSKLVELNGVWWGHKKTGEELLKDKIGGFNQACQMAGIGAVFVN